MFSNQLREIREARGLSQVELARRARMAPQNVSAIELGKLAPWTKAKRRLAHVLKVTESELFPEG